MLQILHWWGKVLVNDLLQKFNELSLYNVICFIDKRWINEDYYKNIKIKYISK